MCKEVGKHWLWLVEIKKNPCGTIWLQPMFDEVVCALCRVWWRGGRKLFVTLSWQRTGGHLSKRITCIVLIDKKEDLRIPKVMLLIITQYRWRKTSSFIWTFARAHFEIFPGYQPEMSWNPEGSGPTVSCAFFFCQFSCLQNVQKQNLDWCRANKHPISTVCLNIANAKKRFL